MPLPRQLVYNDLSGEEVCHILQERFAALLREVPYLQKHITLPRLKMTLDVHLDVYADQPNPERHSISDTVDIKSDTAPDDSEMVFSGSVSDVVNAAPGPGGKPPDQVRDEHGLGIPTPTRGTLGAPILEDRVEGRRVTMANGAIVDRTGKAEQRSGSTVVVQDFGKAGLADGQFNRPDVARPRGGHDGQGVPRPVLHKDN